VRSRPDLKVYLSPAEPTPGTRLSAQVVLLSRSETPIDGVEAHLAAIEQRHAGTAVVGNVPVAQYQTCRHMDLVARSPKAVLTSGEHRFTFAFDIPPGAPPAYRSAISSIEYDLHVRVYIPWWPDRSARYVVPVAARPSTAPGAAATFCTDARGPQGSALYIEASLETGTIPLGGVIRGAVSLANVAQHRVRRIDLALVHAERARATSALAEVERFVVHLHEGPPPEGQAVPFQVALPGEASPSFVAGLMEVRWYLEVRAVISLGSDVLLTVPIEVVRGAAGTRQGPMPLARVPPVGRDRRALIWAESARKNGLANDAANERMTLDLGGASLAITLEPRKAGGLALTASLSWPRLGIDLAVAERRWVDAWSGGLITIEWPGFAERFAVRGREAAQVRAFLDGPLCRWLLFFDEAAVGDEGSTLVSYSTAQSVDELDAFVSLAVSTARALGDAASRVPPPEAMAPHLPAWRTFAALLGGRLLVGEMAIHDAAFEEVPLVIATEWGKDGAPSATVVRFPLPDREGAAAEPRALDGSTRALIESLTPQVTALDLGERAVEARLPAPLADPAMLEPILAGLGRLARRLSGAAARGPYR
jgi:hypothetical protein